MISKNTKLLWIITRAAAYIGSFSIVMGILIFLAFADFQLATERALDVKMSEDQLASILDTTILQPTGLIIIGIILYFSGIISSIIVGKKYYTAGVHDVEIEIALDRVERLQKRNRKQKEVAEKQIAAVDEMEKLVEARVKA